MFCPKCGKQLNDGDTFCAFCGEPLNNNVGAAQPLPTQYQSPTSVPNDTVQAKRSNPLVVFFSALAVGLVLIGGFMLFINPGYLLERDDDDSSRPKREKNNSSVTAESSAAPTSESPEAEPAETDTAAETVTATTTTTVTTAAPETTAPTETTTAQTTTAADEGLEEKNAVYSEAMSLSTADSPKFDEFEWCFGQGGLVYEAPAGADMMTEPLGYSGGWKAMVIYNPTNSAGTFMRELDNVSIEVNGDSVVITIDWYLMETDVSGSYSEEDMEDSVFFGSVTDTGIYASGDAEISINNLWRADGSQYALGAIVTSDGLPAYLAMVRP